MSSISKFLLGTGVGVGVFAGIKYFLGLKKMQQEIEIIPTVNIQKIDLKGLVIKIDVQMKNPTQGTMNLHFPYVKLQYKGTVIGSSSAINKYIKIPAYGEAKIEEILITVPLLNIFSLGVALYKSLQNKETVKLDVRVLTVIQTPINKIPYESSTEVMIRK
jgi:hypothetical protein